MSRASSRELWRTVRGIVAATIASGLAGGAAVTCGEAPAAADEIAPLPPRPEAPNRGPPRAVWGRKTARITALRTDLDAAGAHTHANWIFFRLPFDVTDVERVRDVRIDAGAAIDPDVSAIRIGTCMPFKSYGPIDTWAGYTTAGIGPTLRFDAHPSPPTTDPTIFGLNVPSRVANYVTCGWEKSAVLRDPATWHINVSWEER